MDEYCGSKFWNYSLVWETDDPDLTPCFQQTVLVYAPCALLWLFSPMELYYAWNSKKKNVPWSFLNISKLLLTALLIALSFVNLGHAISLSNSENVFNVSYYTPTIKILTFLLSATLLFLNKRHGIRTSGLQFLFWFLLAVFAIPEFRSEIRKYDDKYKTELYFITYMIYFPTICLIWFLNCFVDKEPTFSEYEKSEKPCPESQSGFLARLFFIWFDPMAWLGFRKPLETTDLWEMNPEDQCIEVVPLFDKYWDKTVAKYKSTVGAKASFSKVANSVDIVDTKPKKQKHASIMPALYKAFGGTFAFGSLLKLSQDVMIFVSPQILSALIKWTTNKNEELWKGYFYAALLFLTATIQTLVLSQYFNRMFLVGMRIRTALISAIYRKALRMSNSAKKESTVGEIVNLMAVDAQRFIDLVAYINMLWSAPLQIILCMYFLWEILGPSVLAGLAVMIILIPVNGVIANKVKTLQIRQMKNKDERVKLMNEVLSGIKVLKLYAWEPSFEAQVLKIRDKEIKVLKEAAYLNAGTSFIWSCAPFLVTLVTFTTYVLTDENNILKAKKAFTSLALFNILKMPIAMLPMIIANTVQASVSVKRINKFMNCEELDPSNITHEKMEDPLLIENGTFAWDEGEPTLKDINLKVKNGNLQAVVGTVGSGKSSLLSAFLGEMEKISGRINTFGTIAYVPQQAWIQNATLQDNILFGKPMDKAFYAKVVEACALKPDFEMLPGGDQTEIGEKGINLSGGQKQRVSLARAVYNGADIYFLDDPLSAVDSHVGKHIFEQVIGPCGLLKNKTRILVTHGITYLPYTSNIAVLVGGSISETGTYKELLDKKGAFADFLVQHIQNVGEQEEDIGELKQQLEQHLGAEEFNNKLQRARSRTDSQSDTASLNGSINQSDSGDRKNSLNRSDSSLRRRSSAKEVVQQPEKTETNVGEKLIEAEKAETGNVKWSVYSHYLRSIGLVLSLTTILLNLVFQGFSIGSNMWLTVWSNDAEHSAEPDKRDMYLGVYGALGIGQALAMFVGSLLLSLGTVLAAKVMHNALFSRSLKAPMSFFDTTPLGRIINRFSKDIDVIDNVLPMVIRTWINMLFTVVGTLVVISIATPIFAAVIVPIGIIYYFVQRFYVATSRQLKRLESVSRSPIYSHFGETVTGATTIRAYQVQDRFVRESESKVDFNQVCYYPSIIANRWLAVRLEMVGNLIIFFAALFAVLGRDSEGSDAGLVGLSVSYALQITQTLNWLVRMTSDVETNIVAVERIKEYAETPTEAPWDIPSTQPKADWPVEGCVEFRDYQVRYREGLDLVLRGVNFKVHGGEKVGIIGRTGAGKSSLTLALFRIIESAGGSIYIDGIDISKLGLHALRSRLTIIPQDPVLFSGTLRINLDPFDAHSDEEVWRALEHAHLKEFVKGLSAGLTHEVSEGGENLSVGQRQLVCLARALLRKTKVLVLDEATAAVDLETDDLIQTTIKTEFKDCTILTIAHRLNTIMDSDRVIVLDKGQISEFAPPQDLLQNKNSAFYSMAKDAGLAG
uniref:ABC-type glutathione-S-conjugate transporter n=1 Tax=Xenopsylla cheopis TaxID=163159 RepID=A0A6M2DRX2_XENCH